MPALDGASSATRKSRRAPCVAAKAPCVAGGRMAPEHGVDHWAGGKILPLGGHLPPAAVRKPAVDPHKHEQKPGLMMAVDKWQDLATWRPFASRGGPQAGGRSSQTRTKTRAYDGGGQVARSCHLAAICFPRRSASRQSTLANTNKGKHLRPQPTGGKILPPAALSGRREQYPWASALARSAVILPSRPANPV